MPDFPLLGCLHDYKILAAADGSLIIEGPLFTEDKINKNGWGIPSDEAPKVAESFAGKPVRWCPKGKDLIPGVPAEHYCDATNSKKTIVGTIISVTPDGKDSEGHTIYVQKSEITAPNAIKGIKNGDIPASVSMWGHAKSQTADGMMHDIEGESQSIVTEPAYTEANYQWRAMAASINPYFFTLNKAGLEDSVKINGDPSMGDPVPNSTQAPPAQQPAGGAPAATVESTLLSAQVPSVVNNIYAGKEPNTKIPAATADGSGDTNEHNAVCAKCGKPLPAHAKFCPACGAGLHASCPKCGASAAPGDKYCSTCGTALDGTDGDDGKNTAASVDKIVEEKLRVKEDELTRKNLATEIAGLKVSAGILKKQDQETEAMKLYALSASALKEQNATVAALVARIPNESGLDTNNINIGAGASNGGQKQIFQLPLPANKMPSNPLAYMSKFRYNGVGLTMEDVAKYAPPDATTGFPGGSYHQERKKLQET